MERSATKAATVSFCPGSTHSFSEKKLFFFFWSLLSHVKRGIGRDLQLLMQLIIVAGLFTFLAHLQKHKAEIVVTVKLKSGCCSGSVIAFYLIEVSLKQDTLHLQRELEANTFLLYL